MLFGEKRNDLELYSSYTEIGPEQMAYRRITESEYLSLASKHKSLARRLCSGYGALALFCLVFTIGLIISLFTEKDIDLSMRLFIFIPVTLFLNICGVFGLRAAVKERVTRESMTVPGEIVDKREIRGYRGTITCIIYTIAIFGAKQLVKVKYHHSYAVGKTVLIVRGTLMPFLVPIAEGAAEHDVVGSVSAEFASRSVTVPDHQNYRKIGCEELYKYTATDDEYMSLPEDMRSCRPLGRGLASGTWLVSLIVTLACIAGMIYSRHKGDLTMAIMIFGVLFVSGIMLLFMWGAVFRRPLARGTTTYADGIIIGKEYDMGACIFTVIFPESQQYLQTLRVDKKYFEQFGTNERVRLYFNEKYRKDYAVFVRSI